MSKKSIKGYLDEVISETLKSTLHRKALQEKEKQASSKAPSSPPSDSSDEQGDVNDIFSGSDSSGDEGQQDNGSDDTQSKTGEDQSEKLADGDIKTEDVIDRLNAIRAGRSFNDGAIFNALDEYVSNLSTAEKTALLAFADGIAQIVTGEIPGEAATEPKDNPADVKMAKGDKLQQKHVDPNVIKVSNPKTKTSGAEDTSGPVPISPKGK